MTLLDVVNKLGCAEASEVVYQVQKEQDITPEAVLTALVGLEELGLVDVRVLVRLTEEGRKRVA